MHPPTIVEMNHGHICKHSEVFLNQRQKEVDKANQEENCRKGTFYHPKIQSDKCFSCAYHCPLWLMQNLRDIFETIEPNRYHMI